MPKLVVAFRGFANSLKNYSFHKTMSMRHSLQFNIALKKTTIWKYKKERNKQIGRQSKLHFRPYLLLSKTWNISRFIIKPLSGIGLNMWEEKIHFIQTMLRSVLFLPWRNSPSRPRPPHFRRITITLRHTTLGRTPLDERSAKRRHLYLTTHNTHSRQTSMPPAGFEPAVSPGKRL